MRSFFFTLLLVAVSAAQAPSNSGAAQTFPLHAVHLRGSKTYSGPDALAATGLKLHERVSQDQLQQASNRLGSSGVFSTVSYQFMGLPGGGVDVTFDVRDNPQLVPVLFENIVWMGRDELLAALRQRMPLFRDRVPLAGEMGDQLSGAIEQVLAARGVNVKVTSMTQGELGKTPAALSYTAENVNVRIAAIEFSGTQLLDKSLLEDAVRPQLHETFIYSATAGAIHAGVEDVCLGLGYLAAKVGDPQIVLADPSPTAPVVKLTVPIEEGKQYYFSGAEWHGNNAFSGAELAQKISLKPRDLADVLRFRKDLDGARKLYGTKGYLAAKFDLDPQLHDDGTAVFAVEVKEGPQYKMGTFTLKGLAPELEKKLREAWKLPPGAIFDDSYPARFVRETIGALPPGA